MDGTSSELRVISHDAIAALVHAQYAQLPKTGKPQANEWTVLAGVVLSKESGESEVVALGTGTKCLTAAQIAADIAGESVHDAHAEVCARRALRAYLMGEIECAARGHASSAVRAMANCSSGFEVRPGCEFHFYTSEPPCGDAAIFDVPSESAASAAANSTTYGGTNSCTSSGNSSYSCTADDADDGAPVSKRPRADDAKERLAPDVPAAVGTAPHRTGAKPAAAGAMAAEAATGGSVCAVGLVRTKPGRGVRTSCMSCSDKLARWQALGAQGALLSLVLPMPVRFASVTVGPSGSLPALRRAIGRAIGGSHCGRSLIPRLGSTTRRFAHAAPPGALPTYTTSASVPPPVSASSEDAASAHPCSNSLVWAACRGIDGQPSPLCEALNGLSGKRLGANKKHPSPKHRSAVCKARALEQFETMLDAITEHAPSALPEALADRAAWWSGERYAQLKARAAAYQACKAELTGAGGPLKDWVRAPAGCECFVLGTLQRGPAPGR